MTTPLPASRPTPELLERFAREQKIDAALLQAAFHDNRAKIVMGYRRVDTAVFVTPTPSTDTLTLKWAGTREIATVLALNLVSELAGKGIKVMFPSFN